MYAKKNTEIVSRIFCNCSPVAYVFVGIKLNEIGPDDNRPSANLRHHFVKIKEIYI